MYKYNEYAWFLWVKRVHNDLTIVFWINFVFFSSFLRYGSVVTSLSNKVLFQSDLWKYALYDHNRLLLLFSHSVLSDSLQPPWTAEDKASLSFTISQSLLKLMSNESVNPSNHLILCHPLLLLPSIFPSIKAFSNKSTLHIRWPKYWNFSFSISPSNEYSGKDWFIRLNKGLFPLGLTGLIFLLSKGFSRVFSNTTVEKHQFFGTQLSSQSNSHNHTWLLEKP